MSASTLDPIGSRYPSQIYRSVYTTNPLTGQHNTVYNYSGPSPSPSPTTPNRLFPMTTKVYQQPSSSRPRSNSASIPTSPAAFQFNTSTSSLNKKNEPKLKIVVKKSSKFCGQDSKVRTYETRSKNRGKLLLLNNIVFDNDHKQERKGAELDEQNIKDLFKQMGFEVVQHRNKKLSVSKKHMQIQKTDVYTFF